MSPLEVDTELNPYIVFTDLATNLVLILMFFLAALAVVGQVGWEEVRYKDAQEVVREAVNSAFPSIQRPYENDNRNDPPGVQRWVFQNSLLFLPNSVELSDAGRDILIRFANVLRKNGAWRRIRIEGHTMPPQPGERNDWERSAAMAASVARVFEDAGGIAPWFLAISGRAGQNPINPDNPSNPANHRVEILLEYSQGVSYSDWRASKVKTLPALAPGELRILR